VPQPLPKFQSYLIVRDAQESVDVWNIPVEAEASGKPTVASLQIHFLLLKQNLKRFSLPSCYALADRLNYDTLSSSEVNYFPVLIAI